VGLSEFRWWFCLWWGGGVVCFVVLLLFAFVGFTSDGVGRWCCRDVHAGGLSCHSSFVGAFGGLLLSVGGVWWWPAGWWFAGGPCCELVCVFLLFVLGVIFGWEVLLGLFFEMY
jgi:hypothetical protein